MRSPQRSQEEFPTGLAQRLDAACGRFEAEWKAGRRPPIENYLNQVDMADRSALVRELLQIELHYRRSKGEKPGAGEYRQRLASYAQVVAAAFAPSPLPPQNPPQLPNLPPELAANQQYEILRELGRGGMGVVYLARNRLLERLEVLKVLNPELLAKSGGKERFLREMQSAAKLHHPNVVTAYSALQQGDLLVFAMEFVEGEDLAQVVKARGPLPVVNACYYVQQAALGLQHAWDKQMIHRDIKPQNLILARVGKKHVVKILDFGLAKVVSTDEQTCELTGSGKMMGTPDYIAPEQTLDAAKADIRADIYSLGCTLYFLLTGAPPFKGNSLYAKLIAHQREPAPPISSIRPEAPANLEAVVAKMMAKDPAARYQKPAEVVQALAPLVKSEAKSAATVPVARPADVRAATMADSDDATVQAPPRPGILVKPPKVAPSGKGSKKWVMDAVLLCLAGLGLLAGLWAAGVFQMQTRNGAPTKQGDAAPEFEPLFNGKDLSGWKHAPQQEQGWTVENGELIGCASQGTTHLFTQRGDYLNFHLRAEVAINDNGNSGIFFHSPFGVPRSGRYPNGYEAQILHHYSKPTYLTGSLQGRVKAPVLNLAADEWFRLEILAVGNEFTIKINGRITAHYKAPDEQNPRDGYLALQSMEPPTTVVRFRRIDVQRLPRPPLNADLESRIKQLSADIPANNWRLLEERAVLYARGGEWARATEDFTAALKVRPADANSVDDNYAWYRAAPVLLQVDHEAYRRFCQDMLRRFGSTTNPMVAHRTAVACLLSPGQPGDLAPAQRLAKLALTGNDRLFVPWFVFTDCLARYRGGDFEGALTHLAPCLQNKARWTLAMPAYLLSAMAHQRLGRAGKAQGALRVARGLMTGGPFPRADSGDFGDKGWTDWLICQHFCREAEALIGVSP